MQTGLEGKPWWYGAVAGGVVGGILFAGGWYYLLEPRRSEIGAKRQAYLKHGLRVLGDLDPHGRSGDELMSATNLLLGMLNGIATRPFVRSGEDARALAGEVAALFLYGFLERSADRGGVPAALPGGEHDA